MGRQKVEQIGGKSLLDRQWGEKPSQILRQPDKLTEPELASVLLKINDMPEQKQRQLHLDQLVNNLQDRIPDFLTPTLLQLAAVLGSFRSLP